MTIGPSDNFESSQPWPKGAIEDWQRGASYGWIAEKYNRAYPTVVAEVRKAKALGLDRITQLKNRRKGGAKKFVDRTPLSPVHQAIGVKLNRQREFKEGSNYGEFGRKLGTNRLTARKMELGIYDFTLTDLGKIASLLETTVEDLMKVTTPHR